MTALPTSTSAISMFMQYYYYHPPHIAISHQSSIVLESTIIIVCDSFAITNQTTALPFSTTALSSFTKPITAYRQPPQLCYRSLYTITIVYHSSSITHHSITTVTISSVSPPPPPSSAPAVHTQHVAGSTDAAYVNQRCVLLVITRHNTNDVLAEQPLSSPGIM